MSKITGLVMFAVGVAVGSVVTWQYTKKKYEQIAQEEIDSVKDVFAKKESDMEVKVESEHPNVQEARFDRLEDKPDLSEYAAILDKEGYISEEDSQVNNDKPYIISPDSFGEFNEYEIISLTYYSDQVLADENDEKIEDVESIVGYESLAHFGEYEDDAVFVRNDRLKCDYEILMDNRLYSEVKKTGPHQEEA